MKRIAKSVIFVIVLMLLVGVSGGVYYFHTAVKPEIIKGFIAKAAPPPTTRRRRQGRAGQVGARPHRDRQRARLPGNRRLLATRRDRHRDPHRLRAGRAEGRAAFRPRYERRAGRPQEFQRDPRQHRPRLCAPEDAHHRRQHGESQPRFGSGGARPGLGLRRAHQGDDRAKDAHRARSPAGSASARSTSASMRRPEPASSPCSSSIRSTSISRCPSSRSAC